jgi:hypothetical protein
VQGNIVVGHAHGLADLKAWQGGRLQQRAALPQFSLFELSCMMRRLSSFELVDKPSFISTRRNRQCFLHFHEKIESGTVNQSDHKVCMQIGALAYMLSFCPI